MILILCVITRCYTSFLIREKGQWFQDAIANVDVQRLTTAWAYALNIMKCCNYNVAATISNIS